MNRAFLIIFAPAILVIAGYILVLRAMGFSPGYSRLIFAVAAVAIAVAIYWFSRRKPRSADSRRQ